MNNFLTALNADTPLGNALRWEVFLGTVVLIVAAFFFLRALRRECHLEYDYDIFNFLSIITPFLSLVAAFLTAILCIGLNLQPALLLPIIVFCSGLVIMFWRNIRRTSLKLAILITPIQMISCCLFLILFVLITGIFSQGDQKSK